MKNLKGSQANPDQGTPVGLLGFLGQNKSYDMMRMNMMISILRLFVQSAKVSPLVASWSPPSNDHDGDDDGDGGFDDEQEHHNNGGGDDDGESPLASQV